MQSNTKKWLQIAGLASIVILLFTGIMDHEAWTPDEPREAQMAREMLSTQSWIVPTLAGEPFVEKPPLYYWSSASAIFLLPAQINPVHAARLVSAIYGLLMLGLMFYFTRKLFDPDTAFYSTAILGSFAGFWELSHWIRIDSLLSFAVAAAMFSFLYGMLQKKNAFIILGYFFAGLGFLAKGPIAWVFLFPTWLYIFYLEKVNLRKCRLCHLMGMLVMILPVVAWIGLFRLNVTPELWHQWLWDNQLGRFAGTQPKLGHLHGPSYYLTSPFIIVFPWTPLLVGFLIQIRSWIKNDTCKLTQKCTRIMLVWLGISFIILSLAQTKRIIYLYPLLPGFALLLGLFIKGVTARYRYIQNGFVIFICSITAILGFIQYNGGKGISALSLTFHWIPLIGSLIAVGIWFRWRRFWQESIILAYVVCMIFLMIRVIPEVDRFKNNAPSYKAFISRLPAVADDKICGFNLDQTTLASLELYGNKRYAVIDNTADLNAILQGQDSRWRYIIVQTGKSFPPKDAQTGPYAEIYRITMPSGRHLGLIQPDNRSSNFSELTSAMSKNQVIVF